MTVRNEDRNRTLRQMAVMLRQCRRRIIMDEICSSLLRAVSLFVYGLLGISGVFLLVRLMGGLPRAPHVLLVVLVFGVAVFGWAVLRGGLRGPVHVRDAAERLDLAQATHNRIATAMALLKSGDDSPLAAAAIREGREHLERLREEKPHTDPCDCAWRGNAIVLAVGVAMLLAGQFVYVDPTTSGGMPPRPGPADDADSMHASRGAKPDTAVVVNRPDGESVPRPLVPVAPKGKEDIEGPAKGRHEERGDRAQSAGPMAEHAAGTSRKSLSASSSRSASGASGAKADDREKEAPKKKKPKPPTKKPGEKPGLEQPEKKGGSIDADGASGAGSMRTAQNEWSNKAKGRASDSDDKELDEELDEEADENKQRIGAQPVLKNRLSRVSRELSLSMGIKPNEDSSRGRGGPGAQKKARGVASMIMGVPIPGFVKGRLLPGPTKSTQEEIDPTPTEGDYASASTLQPAVGEETVIERYRPSAAVAVMARDYLITHHKDQESKWKEAANE